MSTFQHFNFHKSRDVVIVQLTEPRLFDPLVVTELQDELLALVDVNQPRGMVVNFDGVTQCSTAVINALISVKKRLRKNAGDVHLCRMHPVIREAYRLLNLDGTVFHIHDTEATALAALSAA